MSSPVPELWLLASVSPSVPAAAASASAAAGPGSSCGYECNYDYTLAESRASSEATLPAETLARTSRPACHLEHCRPSLMLTTTGCRRRDVEVSRSYAGHLHFVPVTDTAPVVGARRGAGLSRWMCKAGRRGAAGGSARGQARPEATLAAMRGETRTAPANWEPKLAGTISTSMPGWGAWIIHPLPR